MLRETQLLSIGRRLAPVLCALSLLFTAQARAATSPAEALTKARAEIAADHVYSADALLQEVVSSPDATSAQVQDALYLQTMIYYGDVFGAALLLAPVSGATGKASALGKEVSQQLLLARRAFHVSATSLLNELNANKQISTVKIDLPPFSEAEVEQLNKTMASRETMKELVESYETDQSAGRGMLAKANHFGLYIGCGSALPKQKGRKMKDVDAKLKGGVAFEEARFLDWLATVCIDMKDLIKKEPQAPDLGSLARRADERLKKIVEKDSAFYKNAQARAKAYK